MHIMYSPQLNNKFDIDKYLDRISIKSSRKIDFSFLRELQEKHLLFVPFENINIWNDIKIDLSIESLFKKIVLNSRGGFCYELNTIFRELLRKLGFDVWFLSASVFDKQKNEFGPEFDHMTLLVKLNDSYLVDVGFGDSFRKPISLSKKFSEDLSGTYRIDTLNEDFTLQKLESEKWISLYKFSIIRRKLSDFNRMCLFNSTSKESSFTRRKICTIALPKGRKTLSDESFTLTVNKSKIRIPLDGYENYITFLKNVFGIDVHHVKKNK